MPPWIKLLKSFYFCDNIFWFSLVQRKWAEPGCALSGLVCSTSLMALLIMKHETSARCRASRIVKQSKSDPRNCLCQT